MVELLQVAAGLAKPCVQGTCNLLAARIDARCATSAGWTHPRELGVDTFTKMSGGRIRANSGWTLLRKCRADVAPRTHQHAPTLGKGEHFDRRQQTLCSGSQRCVLSTNAVFCRTTCIAVGVAIASGAVCPVAVTLGEFAIVVVAVAVAVYLRKNSARIPQAARRPPPVLG